MVALAPVEVLGLLCGSPMLAPAAVLPAALWGVVACGQRVWLSCAAWASVSVLTYCAASALCVLSWSVCGRVQRAAGHSRSPCAHSCWLCAHKIQADVARLCARLTPGLWRAKVHFVLGWGLAEHACLRRCMAQPPRAWCLVCVAHGFECNHCIRVTKFLK